MESLEEMITFNYNNKDYTLKMFIIRDINNSSDLDKISITISKLFDVIQWKLEAIEDDFIKKNKYWRICLGVDSIFNFIKEKFLNKEFEMSFSSSILTLIFSYQNSFQKAQLTIDLEENKSDIESVISSQASSIKSLRDKITELEKKNEIIEKEFNSKNEMKFCLFADKIEKTLKEFNDILQINNQSFEKKIDGLLKLIPSKPKTAVIFDCGYILGSYTYYSSSWTNIPNANGELDIKNKSNIFWECYMSSLYCTANYQVSFRIEIKTNINNEITYWPQNKLGYIKTYVPNTYFPVIKFSDVNNLESGKYTFQLQLNYSSNSSSHPFYFYGGSTGGEMKMTAIYFDI